MIIRDLGGGVFHAEKAGCGNRYLNLQDETGLVAVVQKFRKDNPLLRIINVIPMLDTSYGNKNYDYYIITEPALPQNMPCGCRCLIHGEVH